MAEKATGKRSSLESTDSQNAPKRRKMKRHRYHERADQSGKHALQCVFGDTTNRIGFHSGENSPPISLPGDAKPAKHEKIFRPGLETLAFGVALPLMAVAVETNLHVMAKQYFDPFPTHFHVLLFLLIPVSNLLSWLAVRYKITPLYSTMSLCSGMALGIAVLYSVMLIPQTSMFFGMLSMGTGFLGLAPLFSIPITLLCGTTICKLADREKTFFDAHQLKHLGHLIVLIMVIMVELPSTMTRYYLGQVDRSGNPKEVIQWLRQWGSPEVLLRACYERSGEATDILGSIAENMHPVPVERARAIYYQVTGVAFNSVPIPPSFRGTIKNSGVVSDPSGLNEGVEDEFDLDPDIAGELVSGVARGLSVAESNIEGAMNAANGIGILDWSFTFENVSATPREARAKILLPPNAVITKASIVLDGVEKETVIQERGLARNTYVNSVYSHKKDPLLVSMDGLDSVLVQCYPVRKGSETKIKLHIVSPLVVSAKDEESLTLPTFEERNFAIAKPHKLSLVGDSKISIPGVAKTEKGDGGKQLLNATLDNSLLARFSVAPKIEARSGNAEELTIRPPESSVQARQAFYSELPTQEFGSHFERLAVRNASTDKPLTIVVDKSITMAPYMDDIISALNNAPGNVTLSLVNVHDGVEYFLKESLAIGEPFKNAIAKFANVKCEGGQSDARALDQVMRADSGSGAILWIHAAQPLADSDTSFIRAQLSNARTTRLYDLQVASGPNAILPESYDLPALSRVARSGSLKADLQTFLTNYAQNKIRRCATTYGARAASSLPEVKQIQAYKLALARYQSGDRYGAYDLAKRYHLVTPVSSAVVSLPDDQEFQVAEEIRQKKVAGNKTLAGLPVSDSRERTDGLLTKQKSISESAPFTGTLDEVAAKSDAVPARLNASMMPACPPAESTRFQAKEISSLEAKRFSSDSDKMSISDMPQAEPVLQGATNGTVGAQQADGDGSESGSGAAGGARGGSFGLLDRFTAMSDSYSAAAGGVPASAPVASSMNGFNGSNGLIGAPLEPHYGQSNASGTFVDTGNLSMAAGSMQRKSHGFLDATSLIMFMGAIFFGSIAWLLLSAASRLKTKEENQSGNPFKD